MKDYRIYEDLECETNETEDRYRDSEKRKVRLTWIMAAGIVLVFLLTIIIDNIHQDIGAALKALFTLDYNGKTMVWSNNVPTVFAAFLAGAGLSLAGAVMQCILKNPLASPYTLGISNAAAFGMAFSILFVNNLVAGSVFGKIMTPLLAFVMAMVATLIILLLVKLTNISPETLVLGGIAMSAIFSAGMASMQYLADSVQLSEIVHWTFGDVGKTTMQWDLVLFIFFMVIFTFFYTQRWTMNAMGAGEEVAKGLGVDTKRFLVIGMVLSSLLSALVVCRFGIIAFVGLLGPHIARLMVGDDSRRLIPMSVLFGGLLMMVASLIADNLFYPQMLPVGLLTSLLGGPVFIYMLVRRYRA